MVKKTQAEKVQEAAEYVEGAAAEILEEYEGEAVADADDTPPPEIMGEAHGAINVLNIPQDVVENAARFVAQTMQQDLPPIIMEAAALADHASQEAAALIEAARQDWNKVFFMIKALKPRMASDEALRTSKLGALLNKLP